VKLNAKGQVTIPAGLREKYGLRAGDEIDVVEDDGVLRIVRVAAARHMASGSRVVCVAVPLPRTSTA
jgi:AbrB family looped-hinge helix DNA binding protein